MMERWKHGLETSEGKFVLSALINGVISALVAILNHKLGLGLDATTIAAYVIPSILGAGYAAGQYATGRSNLKTAAVQATAATQAAAAAAPPDWGDFAKSIGQQVAAHAVNDVLVQNTSSRPPNDSFELAQSLQARAVMNQEMEYLTEADDADQNA